MPTGSATASVVAVLAAIGILALHLGTGGAPVTEALAAASVQEWALTAALLYAAVVSAPGRWLAPLRSVLLAWTLGLSASALFGIVGPRFAHGEGDLHAVETFWLDVSQAAGWLGAYNVAAVVLSVLTLAALQWFRSARSALGHLGMALKASSFVAMVFTAATTFTFFTDRQADDEIAKAWDQRLADARMILNRLDDRIGANLVTTALLERLSQKKEEAKKAVLNTAIDALTRVDAKLCDISPPCDEAFGAYLGGLRRGLRPQPSTVVQERLKRSVTNVNEAARTPGSGWPAVNAADHFQDAPRSRAEAVALARDAAAVQRFARDQESDLGHAETRAKAEKARALAELVNALLGALGTPFIEAIGSEGADRFAKSVVEAFYAHQVETISSDFFAGGQGSTTVLRAVLGGYQEAQHVARASVEKASSMSGAGVSETLVPVAALGSLASRFRSNMVKPAPASENTPNSPRAGKGMLNNPTVGTTKNPEPSPKPLVKSGKR